MAGINSNFQIRVKPDDLRSTAGNVQGTLSTFRNQWGDLIRLIEHTQSYWKGKGAEAKRAEISIMEKDVARMISRISEYPPDLMEMAGLYDTAESTNTTSFGMLPIDVIF
jgi:WXG100 family type VII secretion target